VDPDPSEEKEDERSGGGASSRLLRVRRIRIETRRARRDVV